MGKKWVLGIVVAVLCLSFFNAGISCAETNNVARWEIDSAMKNSLNNPLKLFLEDKQILGITKDVRPIIIRGKTLIPARALFENMGYKVTWNPSEQAVYVKGVDKEIKLVVSSEKALVNQEEYKLVVPAMIVDFNKDGKGTTMIPLRFTAEALGCNVKWIGEEHKVIVVPPIPISGNEHIIQGQNAANKPNSDIINKPNSEPISKPDIDNTVKPEKPSVTPTDMTEQDEKELAKKLVSYDVDLTIPWLGEKLNPVAAEKIIVIDIGHGDKDTGAVGHKDQADQLMEKEANLLVGNKLYANLVRAGAKVYLTRNTDIYYTLKERAAMANGIGATIFVSIHNNSSTSSKPKGTETIYNTKVKEGKTEMELYGITSKTIAKNVQQEMIEALGTKDRGIKNRPELGVVRMTKMPAIIVEGAFLSNEEDFALMKQPWFSEKYAEAVANGLVKSMNEAYK